MKKITLFLVLLIVSTICAHAQWQKLDLTKTGGGTIPGVVNQMALDNNKLYAATTDGIWESASGNGGDWTPYGLQGNDVKYLSFGTLKLAVVFIVSTNDGTKKTGQLYKLVSGSWVKTNFNPTAIKGFDFLGVAQLQNGNQNILFMSSWGAGIWRSLDAGDSWTQYSITGTNADGTVFKNVLGLYTFPGDNVIYGTDKVAAHAHYIIYSTDYGITWNSKVSGDYFNPYAFHKRKMGAESFVYFGGENGNIGAVWRSGDNGTNWDASFSAGVPFWQNRMIIGKDDGPLYIMCSINDIYVSKDNGDSFTPMATTPIPVPTTRPNNNLYYTHMVLSADKLYVSTQVEGIYASSLTTAIPTVGETKIECYPNPTQNELFVNTEVGAKVTIWTVTGKIVQSLVADNSKARIDVKNLQSALYIVKVMSPNGKQYVGHFVKN